MSAVQAEAADVMEIMCAARLGKYATSAPTTSGRREYSQPNRDRWRVARQVIGNKKVTLTEAMR